MQRVSALVAQWRTIEAELLTAKQQAEKASATKSDFLAAISHEVRTLMTPVIGFAEVLIEERFGRLGNDHYRQYVRDIHYTGTQVVSLVSQLLELAKIEAGKLELTLEQIELNELVKGCVSMMQPQSKSWADPDPLLPGARPAANLGGQARDPAGSAQSSLERDQIHRRRRTDHRVDRSDQ